MGLAEIIPLIWVVMAGVVGWKRMGKLEFASFFSVSVSLVMAYAVAFVWRPSIGSPNHAVTARWVLFTGLWLVSWVLLAQLGQRWLNRNAGTQIEMDEYGRPKMGKVWLLKALGAFFGFLRGAALYVGLVSVAMVLVPTFFYAKGRGTALVHPGSPSMNALVRYHPELHMLEQVAGGLRFLRQRRTRAVRRALRRTPALRRLLKRKDIRALLRKKMLLFRANHPRQGKKSATLLLWMPSFQRLFSKQETVSALQTLASAKSLR